MKMATSSAFKTLAYGLEWYQAIAGMTVRHHTQPASWRWCSFVVFLTLDFAIEALCVFWFEYDERLYFLLGNIGAIVLGPKHFYFCVILLFKALSVLWMYSHILSNFSWIDVVHSRLVLIRARVDIASLDVSNPKKRVRLLVIFSHSMFLATMLASFCAQVLVHHVGRLPWWLLLPCLMSAIYMATIYLYIICCSIGEYYLLFSACNSLVRASSRQFQMALRTSPSAFRLDQSLRDFTVVTECVHTVCNYANTVYSILVIIASMMIPLAIFNIAYAGMPIVVRIGVIGVLIYFLTLIALLSYLPGYLDTEFVSAYDQLYLNIVFFKTRLGYLPSLRFKVYRLFTHASNGLGMSILGHRINFSTCISITTMYITVFSLLANLRNSVDTINF